jgi:hypothetical protein
MIKNQLLAAFECSAFDPIEAKAGVALVQQGDQTARVALHTALAQFVSAGEPIPDALRPYLLLLLDVGRVAPGKRGISPHGDAARNECICQAIKAVVPYGFDPTRNEATEGLSACAIVQEELETLGLRLAEKTLNDIWLDRAAFGQFSE